MSDVWSDDKCVRKGVGKGTVHIGKLTQQSLIEELLVPHCRDLSNLHIVDASRPLVECGPELPSAYSTINRTHPITTGMRNGAGGQKLNPTEERKGAQIWI